MAEMVQARRVIGGIESAVFADRSINILLKLLVRLEGQKVPEAYEELAERARSVVTGENLLAEDLSADVALVHEMRERFVRSDAPATAAEDRRYDRAFVRSGEMIGAASTYLDQRLPPEKSSMPANLGVLLAVLAAAAVGVVVGRRSVPESNARAVVSAPPSASARESGSFAAVFFHDPNLKEVAFTRRDPSVAFDWESDAPAEGFQTDHFSASWEGNLAIERAGKYDFYLTSDDGSRLSIDGSLVIDNWGNHGPLTMTGSADLTKGSHTIHVDYFDNIGTAMVKLEWSSEFIPRRLLTGADLERTVSANTPEGARAREP
jgi:hypothetical protein